MQVYSNLCKVVVSSRAHGDRTFLVTARSASEGFQELKALLEPWLRDPDLVITISGEATDIFVVVTDRARVIHDQNVGT